MEKLVEMCSKIEKIAEIYRDRQQVALLLPGGLIEVISEGNVLFFANISSFTSHSIGGKIMVDEIVDFDFLGK